MPEIICNTSPLQYLHQLKLLDALHRLAKHLVVPQAVAEELRIGAENGWDVPKLQDLSSGRVTTIAQQTGSAAKTLFGPGETEVLALGLEAADPVLILDDRLARQVAASLGFKLTGTLGLLLDSKKAGIIPSVAPLLDQLQRLGFRISPGTRASVLKLAGES